MMDISPELVKRTWAIIQSETQVPVGEEEKSQACDASTPVKKEGRNNRGGKVTTADDEEGAEAKKRKTADDGEGAEATDGASISVKRKKKRAKHNVDRVQRRGQEMASQKYPLGKWMATVRKALGNSPDGKMRLRIVKKYLTVNYLAAGMPNEKRTRRQYRQKLRRYKIVVDKTIAGALVSVERKKRAKHNVDAGSEKREAETPMASQNVDSDPKTAVPSKSKYPLDRWMATVRKALANSPNGKMKLNIVKSYLMVNHLAFSLPTEKHYKQMLRKYKLVVQKHFVTLK